MSGFFKLAVTHGVLCISPDAIKAILTNVRSRPTQAPYWRLLIKQCEETRFRKEFIDEDIEVWMGGETIVDSKVLSIDDLLSRGALFECEARSRRATLMLRSEADRKSIWCEWLEPLAAHHKVITIFDHYIGLRERGWNALGWFLFELASMRYSCCDKSETNIKLEVLCGSEVGDELSLEDAVAQFKMGLQKYCNQQVGLGTLRRDVSLTIRWKKDWKEDGRKAEKSRSTSAQKNRWIRFSEGCPGSAAIQFADGIDRLACKRNDTWDTPLSVQFVGEEHDILALRSQEEFARAEKKNPVVVESFSLRELLA